MREIPIASRRTGARNAAEYTNISDIVKLASIFGWNWLARGWSASFGFDNRSPPITGDVEINHKKNALPKAGQCAGFGYL